MLPLHIAKRRRAGAGLSVAIAAALAVQAGCGAPAPPGKTPTVAVASATASASAAPAPRTFPQATRERAGALECTLDSPVDVANLGERQRSILGINEKLVFDADGGLLTWQPGDGVGMARPLGRDGRPTGRAQEFHAEGSYYPKGMVSFEKGFALVYSLFDVDTLNDSYHVQVFSRTGEARGDPVELDMRQNYFEGMSAMVGGRFVVLGGPNQGKRVQSARVIVVQIDNDGKVQMDVTPFPITAPSATRPAVAFALSPEHWAITVQVPSGPSSQPFLLGGQTVQQVPIAGVPTTPQGLYGGIEALIVDGDLHSIEGSGAGVEVSIFSTANCYDIAWSGDALVARWPVEGKGWKGTRHARLAQDGKLTLDTSAAVRGAFTDDLRVSYESSSERTVLFRATQLGVHVGNPTRIDNVLPDVGGGMINMDIVWSGDRFVIAHEAKARGKLVLRTAGLHCDGGEAAPAPR